MIYNINEFSLVFQRYLEDRLLKMDMSGRQLARLSGCDEGEISHVRRRGHIPRRPMVASIGKALGDEDGALLAAGYVPRPGYILRTRRGGSGAAV